MHVFDHRLKTKLKCQYNDTAVIAKDHFREIEELQKMGENLRGSLKSVELISLLLWQNNTKTYLTGGLITATAPSSYTSSQEEPTDGITNQSQGSVQNIVFF